MISLEGRDEAGLVVAPGGREIFFWTVGPTDDGGASHRDGDSWSAAAPVGRPVNGRNNTGGPSVSRDGTLYFTLMDFESGVQKLFRAEPVDGGFSEPTRLPDGVNASLQNFESYVDPDGRYLVFATFERQGHENNPGDLRIALRDETGGWLEAVSLGPPINTDDQIGSLQLSADGRLVFFARSSGAGPASKRMGMDIYWVDAAALSEAGPSGGPE